MTSFLKEFCSRFPRMEAALTTNAALLTRYAAELANAGISKLNISLDTLDPHKFKEITRVGDIQELIRGIDAAVAAGIGEIKTNTVLIRGFNDGEIPEILRFAWDKGILPRLIEFMPLGDDVWRREKFISAEEILSRLSTMGEWRETVSDNTVGGPAVYYRDAVTGKSVGVIAAVTNHFCSFCNRLRISATGRLRTCLFNAEEIDLLRYIRSNDRKGLAEAIEDAVKSKPGCWEDIRDGSLHMSNIGG